MITATEDLVITLGSETAKLTPEDALDFAEALSKLAFKRVVAAAAATTMGAGAGGMRADDAVRALESLIRAGEGPGAVRRQVQLQSLSATLSALRHRLTDLNDFAPSHSETREALRPLGDLVGNLLADRVVETLAAPKRGPDPHHHHARLVNLVGALAALPERLGDIATLRLESAANARLRALDELLQRLDDAGTVAQLIDEAERDYVSELRDDHRRRHGQLSAVAELLTALRDGLELLGSDLPARVDAYLAALGELL
jgi:hypothetical protein